MAMNVNGLYSFVLALVMVGLILGVGLVVLSNFASTSGVSGDAETAINSTISAMTPIASTWLPLIVTITVLGIIIAIVMGAFSGSNR